MYFQGDSGYPLLPFLMNVVQGNDLPAAERHFNRDIRSIRQIIERVIGILKMRFRCILGERQLRYHQTKSAKIICACATLHNFLIDHRYNIFHDIDENDLRNLIDMNNDRLIDVLPVGVNRINGIARRNELVAMYQQ